MGGQSHDRTGESVSGGGAARITNRYGRRGRTGADFANGAATSTIADGSVKKLRLSEPRIRIDLDISAHPARQQIPPASRRKKRTVRVGEAEAN